MISAVALTAAGQGAWAPGRAGGSYVPNLRVPARFLFVSRAALPWRRLIETREFVYEKTVYTLSIGYYPGATVDEVGPAGECFADGAKIGSDRQATLADACVLISIALQHGITPGELGHSLARVPRWTPEGESEGPASVIGAIVEALA